MVGHFLNQISKYIISPKGKVCKAKPHSDSPCKHIKLKIEIETENRLFTGKGIQDGWQKLGNYSVAQK